MRKVLTALFVFAVSALANLRLYMKDGTYLSFRESWVQPITRQVRAAWSREKIRREPNPSTEVA